MIIDLRSLKLHPGSSDEFVLESRGDQELLLNLPGRFLDPVQVEILVHNSGRCFNAQGRLQTRVELLCSRCLEKVVYPIVSRFHFTVESETQGHSDSDEDILSYNSGEVDLQPLINELIVTELPLTPLCQAECQGLCPICGNNRNTSRCACQDQAIDPRWEKLNKLR